MTLIGTPSGSGQRPHPRSGSHLARSAGITGAATLTSRVLGLVRDQVLALLFGASDQMDAFIVAFRIPNLVRDLFAEGAMSAPFVPPFTRRLTTDGRDAAFRIGSNVLTGLIAVTGILAVAGVLFARPLVGLYAARFADTPGKFELTVQLTRVLLPFLMLVAVAAAMMGMLNSLHHYFVPAVSPAMFNVAIILGGVVLVPMMPRLGLPPIMGIAVAALAGGVGQAAVQWPALHRAGFRYRPVLDLRDRDMLRVMLLMGPGAVGLAATQVNVLVNTLLATSQGSGAVSWLTYSFRLVRLPIGLVSVSIATAVLPAIAGHAAAGDTTGIRQTLSRGLVLMLMLVVPATAGLLTLAPAIVRLLFEHGRFLPVDTAETAAALRLYAIGLVGYSTVRIVSPAFYAIDRSAVPIGASVATIALNLVLGVTLVRMMGFRGLALATSLAALANAAVLVWLLRHHLHGVDGNHLISALVRIVAAALAMAAVVVAAGRGAVVAVPGGGSLPQALRLAFEIGAGLAGLAVAARLLRIREFDEAFALFAERIRARAGTDVAR
jgi:putative peptidoglycan lipid II flippase